MDYEKGYVYELMDQGSVPAKVIRMLDPAEQKDYNG